MGWLRDIDIWFADRIFIYHAQHRRYALSLVRQKDEAEELVQEASNAAYDHTIEHIKGLADDALAKIQEASDEVTVTRLNEEQIQAFRERAPQVEEAFLEMTGDRGEELLQQFKADLEAVNSDS